MAIGTQDAVNDLWGEPLTYIRAGVGTTHTFTGGRHVLGEVEGRTSYGVYTVRRELFTFSDSALGCDVEPRVRDTIRPANKSARVVVDVQGSPFLKFWKVEAHYPQLNADLDATATVYRPSPTPTDEGFVNPGLAAVYTSYAVRLQPDTRTREWDTVGKVTTRSKFVCVFGTAVTLNAGDVIRVSSVDYEVTEQSEIESLGLLTFAACERIS